MSVLLQLFVTTVLLFQPTLGSICSEGREGLCMGEHDETSLVQLKTVVHRGARVEENEHDEAALRRDHIVRMQPFEQTLAFAIPYLAPSPLTIFSALKDAMEASRGPGVNVDCSAVLCNGRTASVDVFSRGGQPGSGNRQLADCQQYGHYGGLANQALDLPGSYMCLEWCRVEKLKVEITWQDDSLIDGWLYPGWLPLLRAGQDIHCKDASPWLENSLPARPRPTIDPAQVKAVRAIVAEGKRLLPNEFEGET